MVVDTSILLSIFFNQEHADWALEKIEVNKASLLMSTVNLTETLILIEDRQAENFSKISEEIFSSNIQFIPPSVKHGQIAAKARLQFKSLNFGDCFAYALAKEKELPVLTLDSDFAKTDLKEIVIP